MKVLINPKIIINEPVKNKKFGFYVTMSKKDTQQLTVKAKSYPSKSRGIVGKITKGGDFIIANNYKNQLPHITEEIQVKIDVLLDLVYGTKRDRKVEICKKGMVYFNKN